MAPPAPQLTRAARPPPRHLQRAAENRAAEAAAGRGDGGVRGSDDGDLQHPAAGPEAAVGAQPGAVLQRIAAQRQSDRQRRPRLPGIPAFAAGLHAQHAAPRPGGESAEGPPPDGVPPAPLRAPDRQLPLRTHISVTPPGARMEEDSALGELPHGEGPSVPSAFGPQQNKLGLSAAHQCDEPGAAGRLSEPCAGGSAARPPQRLFGWGCGQ